MQTAMHGPKQLEFERVWRFFAAARALPCDRMVRVAILFALFETEVTHLNSEGASIAALTERIVVSREVIRHNLRSMRADGLVVLAGRKARTELFKISDQTRKALGDCFEALASRPKRE